jgi:hypothetical protein
MTTIFRNFGLGASVVILGLCGPVAYGVEAPPAGSPVTVTGESERSEKEAMDNAFRQAVESAAAGVLADRNVPTLLRESILARAGAYAKNPQILERQRISGRYIVKVQTAVGLDEIREDLEKTGLKGRPSLLIVCDEEIIWAEVGQPLPGTGNISEYALRDFFLDRGFNVVDDETLARAVGRDVTRKMLANDEELAVTAAKQLHAAFVVLGRARGRALQASGAPYGIPMREVFVDILVKAVATDNAQQVASKTASARRSSQEATTAASQGLKMAAADVAPELLRQMLAKWSEPPKVVCIGERVPTDLLDTIVQGLRATPGVRRAAVLDHNPQRSTVEIITWVEALEIAKAVQAVSATPLEVTDISEGRVAYRPAQQGASVPLVPPSVGAAPTDIAPETPAEPAPQTDEPMTPHGKAPDTEQEEQKSPLPLDLSFAFPPWVMPAVVSAAAVAVAFLVGLFIAWRKRPAPPAK